MVISHDGNNTVYLCTAVRLSCHNHAYLKAAGLAVVSEVLVSEAYLITSKHSKHPDLVELIRKRIVGYITACRLMI